jgi:DNA modification methylase
MTLQTAQETPLGKLYIGASDKLLADQLGDELAGKVQLIFTSPPFPLNKKKKYGNLQGEEYLVWIAQFAPLFARLLKPDGSVVMELGNAWEHKRPVQSLLPMRTLLKFIDHPEAGLRLCQEFVCHNPSRLPGPTEWVNKKRIRLTDSYTHLWWMAKSDFPKANNRNVQRPYSDRMKELHQTGDYNKGRRPSGHKVEGNTFLVDNGGSIMPNFIEAEAVNEGSLLRLPANVFSIAHTNSNDHYMRQCEAKNIDPHPARMPLQLVDFFIRFLTEPGDLILDPFAGSNATGYCAEITKRRWVSIEIEPSYLTHSDARFSEFSSPLPEPPSDDTNHTEAL